MRAIDASSRRSTPVSRFVLSRRRWGISEPSAWQRPARFNGVTIDCPVYQREKLNVGVTFEGPAIIDQLDCTTVIPPGHRARVDDYRNILVSIGGI